MVFFFFNDTATTEIYTLSLHDALPIFVSFGGVITINPYLYRDLGYDPIRDLAPVTLLATAPYVLAINPETVPSDRKSTRLNSSHANISYAVFCLKKKKKIINH